MTGIEKQRRFYAEFIALEADVKSPILIDSFAKIPREDFLGKGPWLVRGGKSYISTPTDDLIHVYQNVLFAICEKRKINNGLP